MHITIIGLGLIGGSLSKALKKSGFATRITGVEQNPTHAAEALALGLADEILPLPEAIQQSKIIIVATPVNTLLHLLPYLLDHITPDQIVIEVGSTKGDRKSVV